VVWKWGTIDSCVGELKRRAILTLCHRNLGPREGRGNIINVASMYGLIGGPAHVPCSPYVAAKHGKHPPFPYHHVTNILKGVIGLTKSVSTFLTPLIHLLTMAVILIPHRTQ
jgi:hypothetical protein